MYLLKREVSETRIFLRSSSDLSTDQTDAISLYFCDVCTQSKVLCLCSSEFNYPGTYILCLVCFGWWALCQALAYKWCVLPRNTGVRQGRSNADSPLQLSLRFVETFMTTLLIFPVTEAAADSFIHFPFK